jgi:hypothetical protein
MADVEWVAYIHNTYVEYMTQRAQGNWRLVCGHSS